MKADTMNNELPPLPERYRGSQTEVNGHPLRLFAAHQMQDYARAAILADRASRSRAASEPGEVARLTDEVEKLRELAATCYAGLGAECNLPEPWLDALSNAISGEAFSLDGLLPFVPQEAAEGQKAVADTFEHYVALREGSCNGVIDEYFRAREGWNLMPHGIFKDGFYRGFDARDTLSPEPAIRIATTPTASMADAAEAVGEAGPMPGTAGFTMACFKAADVPVGTKLYATPGPRGENN